MQKTKIRELLNYGIVFVVTLFISTQVLFSYRVSGSSMFPTLDDGEIGVALRTSLNVKEIKRFDIVVIKLEDRYIVKRVIGLPNDIVEYKDNLLYINGEYVEQKFLNSDVVTEDFMAELGDDEYFCMGDNRPNSADSRVYGNFSKDNIEAILFNFSSR